MNGAKSVLILSLFLLTGCGMSNSPLESEMSSMQADHTEDSQIQTVDDHPVAVNNGQLAKLFPKTVFLSGPSDVKKIALTFDDGPDPRVTGDLLDVLAKEKVPATFFLMGVRVDSYPDLVKRIADEGHSIGSHGYWHSPLINYSDEQAEADLEKASLAISQAVGEKPILYRPPFGALNEEKVELLEKLGYKAIIWSVDSEDWKEPEPGIMAEEVIKAVKPGSIILHHDGGNWNLDLSGTVTAVQQEITELKKQGYTFVTVSELLGL